MEEFRIPKKLVALTKMCTDDIQYQISVEHTISEASNIRTGLRQKDALFPTLLNKALEKAIREMQMETTGVAIGEHHIQVLGFADDLNNLRNFLKYMERAARVPEQAAILY